MCGISPYGYLFQYLPLPNIIRIPDHDSTSRRQIKEPNKRSRTLVRAQHVSELIFGVHVIDHILLAVNQITHVKITSMYVEVSIGTHGITGQGDSPLVIHEDRHWRDHDTTQSFCQPPQKHSHGSTLVESYELRLTRTVTHNYLIEALPKYSIAPQLPDHGRNRLARVEIGHMTGVCEQLDLRIFNPKPCNLMFDGLLQLVQHVLYKNLPRTDSAL